MAPTGRRGACTHAQRHGGQTESSAVTESEAPGPMETLAVHPGGALNARFCVQDLGMSFLLSQLASFIKYLSHRDERPLSAKSLASAWSTASPTLSACTNDSTISPFTQTSG